MTPSLGMLPESVVAASPASGSKARRAASFSRAQAPSSGSPLKKTASFPRSGGQPLIRVPSFPRDSGGKPLIRVPSFPRDGQGKPLIRVPSFPRSSSAEKLPPAPEKAIFRFDNRPIGVGLDDGPEGAVWVRDVEEGTASHFAGLPIGSILLEINGISVAGMDAVDVQESAAQASMPLSILVQLPRRKPSFSRKPIESPGSPRAMSVEPPLSPRGIQFDVPHAEVGEMLPSGKRLPSHAGSFDSMRMHSREREPTWLARAGEDVGIANEEPSEVSAAAGRSVPHAEVGETTPSGQALPPRISRISEASSRSYSDAAKGKEPLSPADYPPLGSPGEPSPKGSPRVTGLQWLRSQNDELDDEGDTASRAPSQASERAPAGEPGSSGVERARKAAADLRV